MSLFGKKKKVENEEPIQDATNEPVITDYEDKGTIGSRIAQGRKAKGYTQEEFSQLLNVTAQAVSKWENDLSCPDIQLLPQIASILGVTTDELLTGVKANQGEATPKTEPSINTDTSNLRITINVVKPGQNPVNVTLPFSMVKNFAKIGNGISGIIGNGAIDNVKFDEILELVENGATGEILNVVADDNTVVSIKIQ